MEMSVNHYRKRNWTDREYMTSYNPATNNPLSHHHEDPITCIPENNNSNLSQRSTIHDNIEHLTTTTTSSRSLSPPPIKRVANERERTRTASVNDAFLMLRSLIPTEPINRKLSKIETLRLASSYISHLHAILVTGSGPADQPCLRHQQVYYHSEDNSTINDNLNISSIDSTHHENQRFYDQNNKRHRPVCTFCVTEMKQHQRAIADMNKETILSGGQ